MPLYRRIEPAERQVLAINQVVGVLNTAALVEMRRHVADGAARRRWPTRGRSNTRSGGSFRAPRMSNSPRFHTRHERSGGQRGDGMNRPSTAGTNR